MTYDEWLALSESERDVVHHQQWNVYDREGYVIAMTAAVRLAEACGLKVSHLEVGTFHGGEYVLHLAVPDDDCRALPKHLEQRFEGFRVAWLPISRFMMNSTEAGDITGIWRHEDDDVDVEFVFDVSTAPPAVSGHCLSEGEPLLISNVAGNDTVLLFSSTVPSTDHFARHMFRLVDADTCAQEITLTETWKRVAADPDGDCCS
ncbi:hypothetical protein [Verrucomicrobium sp. BvORR106]|uniref:hypothetical protein n=1 Tax=Verrucomicrobium sp. BvORR106 TaxID=1403819 RepID=UPI00056F049E|nr:hypothetical protein [Verrucomicrobium sp. BvORR106]